MRVFRTVLLFVPLVALLVQAFLPRSAGTLPLFAHKYNIPCTQCHLAFPRLNAFGMAFRQNGYRMPGAKGESPWDSTSTSFPLSLVGNVGYSYTRTDTADAVTGARGSSALGEFRQNAVEFHSAGTLAPEITFHFDNGFSTDTGVLETGMAFVQFDDVAKNGALNIKAGIYDAEIPYLADSRKTTLQGYLAPVTLDGRGVELNGTQSGWTYAAGLIDSDRDPLNAKPGTKTFNRLENAYAWLMRDVHGQLVTARVFVDRQDPRVANATTSNHVQAEVSAFLNRGRFYVIPGYTYQTFDDLPAVGVTDKHSAGLLEALWLIDPAQRWLLTGRWELDHAASTTVSPIQDVQLETVNLSWYANPNAKVALEWSHAADNVGGPKVDALQAYVHIGY